MTQPQRAGSACRQDGGAELGGGGEAGVPEGAARALLPALPAGAARAVLVSGDQQVIFGTAPTCARGHGRGCPPLRPGGGPARCGAGGAGCSSTPCAGGAGAVRKACAAR